VPFIDLYAQHIYYEDIGGPSRPLPWSREGGQWMDLSDLNEILAAWKRERPDLDMAPLRISLLLRRALEVAERRRLSLLTEYGLSPSALDLLATLRRAGAPYRRTPSELARSSLLTAAGISQRMRLLERAGFITRTINEDDRRMIHVELTEEGLKTIDTVLGPYMSQERDMLSAFTKRERGELERLLQRFLATNS
jgi:DNA-binding MarR family transcriptional regulator